MLRRSRPAAAVALSLAVLCLAAACVPASKGSRSRTPATLPPVGPPTRNIVFPIASFVAYSDTFGAPRSGGRSHEGQDLMAPKGSILVAAHAGTVTSIRHSSDGLSGNMLRITDDEGWQYVYIHINNDSPGTDDGANRFDQAFVDGMRVGQKVVPGEPIAFVGDSGNAESTGPHLHFEIRSPDGAAVNAYSSLRAAPVAPLSLLQVIANAPFGAVDAVTSPGPGTVAASGWAMDVVVDDPVPVSLYVDGRPVTTGSANVARPDLAAAFPERTTAHGFTVTASGVAPGPHRVCVVFHNAGAGGGSARNGCADVVVS